MNTAFFRPKPPPTSAAKTRICSIGTPIWGGISNRSMWGDWVDAWIVEVLALRVPDSHQAPALHGNRLVTVH